jgi:RHS repeat-associated protein
MVQDGVEWFGDFTPNVVVTVNPQSGGNPNPEPGPGIPVADLRWIVADHLGTPRMIFDESGSLANVSRHDYLPFGEELTGQIGGRTTQQDYAGDSTRQKFTEKERDAETGLDYFGARYYVSTQGRFTSVDPYNIVREAQITAQNNPEEAKAHLLNYLSKPQQWNRYAYVANNPLKYVDPTGELLELTGTEEEQKAAFERIKWMVGKDAAKNLTMTQMCTSGGHCGTYVTYNETLSGRSGLANSGKLNSYIGQIIDSDKTVEFRIADSFTTKFGETRETGGGFCGGGCTVGSEESTTGNTQIFVNKESSAIAEKTFSEPRMSGRFTGAHLSFEDDIVDAHEFGHAFANAIEGKPLRNSSASYDRAVEFENLQRSTRYPERAARRRVE